VTVDEPTPHPIAVFARRGKPVVLMATSKEPTYASASAVAGLAREVEGLRMAVEPMKSLPHQVDELARVVRTLAEQTAAAPMGGGARSWLDLPGRGTALATGWDEVVSKLGHENLRRHDLRHAALTWFADAGVPVHHLQRIAGHGSLTTTQRYLHPNRQTVADAGALLSKHLSVSPNGPRLRVV
jgi:hypothetical protein